MKNLVTKLDLLANKLFEVLARLLYKISPPKKNKITPPKQARIKKERAKNLIQGIVERKKKTVTAFNQVSANIISNTKLKVNELKQIDFKNRDYKKDLEGVFVIAVKPLQLFTSWFNSLKTSTIAFGAIGISLTIFAIINIYVATKNIEEKDIGPREIASIEDLDAATGTSSPDETSEKNEAPDKSSDSNSGERKAYYKIDKKTFGLSDLYIPIYNERSGSARTVIFDIQIEASNQYIKHYFDSNEIFLRNKLTTTIEPIATEFLLSIEGKEVIKNKIKEEINNTLKELKIKGSIKRVHIHGIIAS